MCAAAELASPRRRGPRSRRTAAVILALLLLAGCDTAADRIPLPETTGPSGTATAVTTPSITPVTPDGLITGPGVTDDSVTLGVLVDGVDDRGFVDGVRLWQEAVNTSGGLCGRRIQLVTSGAAGVPANVAQAYDAVGRSVLGLVILRSPSGPDELSARIAADQIPTLTPTGRSTALGPTLPVVVGATADVLAINGLDYLERTDRIRSGDTVGVLADSSPAAENALAGVRWWAADRGVALDVHAAESISTDGAATGTTPADSTPAGTTPADSTPAGSTATGTTASGAAPNDTGAAGPGTDVASWAPATAVVALTDATTTARLVAQTSPDITVLTTIDGYDPDLWSSPALAAAADGRVLVSSATPAYGSDYPAAVSVAARAAAAGLTVRGPRFFEGYATGVSWDRLLTQACTDRSLTRPSIEQAMTTVGPASVDSLFGPTDPGLVVESGLPATLVSAVSQAAPTVPGGLTPLTWPEAASGIEDYRP